MNAWLNFDLLFSMKDFRQLPKKKKKEETGNATGNINDVKHKIKKLM